MSRTKFESRAKVETFAPTGFSGIIVMDGNVGRLNGVYMESQ